MKKNIGIIAFLLVNSMVFSQVGIGLSSPSAELDVLSKGNTNATKALKISNSSNTEMLTVLNNGNLGIGNPTPTTRLDLNNGTTAGAIKIVDGTQGAGRVLTSDADGIGTWSPTPATSLYFLSASPYTSSTNFNGTVNPLTGVTETGAIRYVTTGTATNLGPATAFTSGTSGLSYRIPIAGLYRLTLYVDQVPSTSNMAISAFRNGAYIFTNSDIGTGSSLVMITLWNLQAGDYVLPSSGGTPPTGLSMNETTFTVERVN